MPGHQRRSGSNPRARKRPKPYPRISQPESVNTLLHVADEEKALVAYALEDCFLSGVDVLAFVNEHVLKAPQVFFSQQAQRELLEVVEIEHCLFTFPRGISLREFLRQV